MPSKKKKKKYIYIYIKVRNSNLIQTTFLSSHLFPTRRGNNILGEKTEPYPNPLVSGSRYLETESALRLTERAAKFQFLFLSFQN